MSYTDKHIVESYTSMCEGLSNESKKELIENLSKSLQKSEELKNKVFLSSFGAFVSELSDEELIKQIKDSRKFNRKNIDL